MGSAKRTHQDSRSDFPAPSFDAMFQPDDQFLRAQPFMIPVLAGRPLMAPMSMMRVDPSEGCELNSSHQFMFSVATRSVVRSRPHSRLVH